MKVVRNLSKLKCKKCAVAIGMFDGVHLGHKKVISSAVEYAKKNKLCSLVLTFFPHPRHIIYPERGIKLLTTDEEKIFFIEKLGIDCLFIMKFSNKLRSMNYSEFASEILAKKLCADRIFVGEDYTFGRNKEGNVAKLADLGKKYNFEVTAVKDKIENRRVVKSSLVRRLIENKKFAHALELLGHPYLIMGQVVTGEGRGKTLGFPTANIEVKETKIIPPLGVYAGFATVGKKAYKAAVNIGKNPTFGGKTISIEAHLLNFHKNINGIKIKIFLVKKIRNEKKFANRGELINAIKKDVLNTGKILDAKIST